MRARACARYARAYINKVSINTNEADARIHLTILVPFLFHAPRSPGRIVERMDRTYGWMVHVYLFVAVGSSQYVSMTFIIWISSRSSRRTRILAKRSIVDG